MIEPHDLARAEAVLIEYLKDNFITRFSIGDTIDLCFNAVWLTTQNVELVEEADLNQWYAENYSLYSSTVDKEYLAKATALAARMRRLVTQVTLAPSGALTLAFEDGCSMLVTVDSDIVDWQWGLSLDNTDPYQDHIVACFGEGEIAINDQDKSTPAVL